MADAAVGFLLSSISDLLRYHSSLISDATSQIVSLQKDLEVFNGFLQDSVKKRRKDDETTKAMVKNIREVAYEVEDIIDVFISKTMARKHGSTLLNIFKAPVDLHGIGKRVRELSGKVQDCRIDIGIGFANATVDHQNKSGQSQDRPPRKKDVVGFVDEADYLRKRLTQDSESFDVVSLVGMLGLGKTTLAWMIYNDPAIIFKFPIRIWLSISQEFSDRDVFLAILKERTTITDDILDKKDHELADLVCDYLETGCFLIVLDDVWEIPHWKRLRTALPYHNIKGKVLLTTRNEDVANYASKPNPIRQLRFFTQEESWELLQLEAVRSRDCPPKLRNIGQVIVAKCGGLPLAIVIIGGLLAINFSLENLNQTEDEWNQMSTRVITYLGDNDPENRMKKLISLSYDKLPYHLRSCFLYLGIFPEDYEIRVSKLIRLWIGEGFIPHKDTFSLEQTAEKYLSELIHRNLVKSDKFKHDGRVKTCRVHDSLRDFCRAEAESENLLKEIKYSNGKFAPPVSDIDKYRRLSLHSNCLSFIPPKHSAPRVRSFVCFSKDAFDINAENSTKLIAAFKFLKVFDVEPFKFKRIDSYFYKLVYMRYIALSTNLDILPPKFDQFWNIQTLIVHTTSRTLEVKADILKMNQLRCFKTNASAILPNPTESSQNGEELQTLGTIAVESCKAELFRRACNLKKLGIRGKLDSLFRGNDGSFVSFGNLKLVEKLKLINDVYPYPSSDAPLNGLPQPNQFPAQLTSLTLCDTYLKWCDHMSTLGSLAKLEVLKLKDYAFTGSIWETADGGFQCLQSLYIENTDLAVWNASSHHFPKLRGLVLQKCEKLQEIPSGLAKIPSFQMLDLLTCKYAAASAMVIKDEKKKTQAEGCAFMLSIFPPYE